MDEFTPGTVIAGRYRLERPIGTGGMATIWEGAHLALNRPIAIKLIDIAGRNTARVRERFLREARVAAAVHHRNVVDILDFGTTDEGRPFMVMERLMGHTLAQRLAAGPAIGVAEAVGILARVLSGLGAVHDAGIVHRDLKPENVFLVDDADGAYPKLLDFGVSRAVDPRGELESVLPTLENAIVGTPQYMSPEQARGLATIDHRADLWSAGVILFELLTGALPFDSDAVGDVIVQIATADPPDLVVLRPDLAGPVEQVVRKALRRRPEDRFQSAREMRSALLAAVAETAAAIRRGSMPPGARASHPPPAAASELLEVVDDAYEPGDSALIDLAHVQRIRARPSARPELRTDHVTLADVGEPRSRRGLWIAGSVVVLLSAAALATGALVSSGGEAAGPHARPSNVRVELDGVPAGAHVTVDGTPERAPVVLARDGRPHVIEVSDADGRRWTVEHRATQDGDYQVQLSREGAQGAREQEPARPARARRARRSGQAPAGPQHAEGLLRDPGF